MANASLGQPLPLSTAVAKYGVQSAYGTAASPTASLGIIRAGYTQMSSIQRFFGPGSEAIMAKVGGAAYTQFQLQIPAVQISLKALLQKALRTNGILPFLTLGIGYEDDVTPTSNKSMAQIKDCVIDQLELSLDAGSETNPLTGSLSGFGAPSPAELTNQSRLTLADAPWTAYQALCTEEGSAFEIERWSLSVNNNASRDHAIRGSAPSGNARGHSYVTPHQLNISGNISLYRKFPYDVHGSSVLNKDLSLVLTSGSDVLTVLLNDCDYDNVEFRMDDQGIRWSFAYTATTWNLT